MSIFLSLLVCHNTRFHMCLALDTPAWNVDVPYYRNLCISGRILWILPPNDSSFDIIPPALERRKRIPWPHYAGFARRRKGLLHTKCFEQLLKSESSILCAPVAVEKSIPPLATVFISRSKGGCNKLTAVLLRNLIGDHFSGIQIEDCTDIVHLFCYKQNRWHRWPRFDWEQKRKTAFPTIGFLLCMESHIERLASVRMLVRFISCISSETILSLTATPRDFKTALIFFAP